MTEEELRSAELDTEALLAKAKEALRSALPKLKQGNNEALYNQAVEYLNNMH